MEAIELRNKIIEIVNTSDERFLHMINDLHKTYKDDDDVIVAFNFKGEPLTKATIAENNKKALNSIEKGEFKTHSEIRNKYKLH